MVVWNFMVVWSQKQNLVSNKFHLIHSSHTRITLLLYITIYYMTFGIEKAKIVNFYTAFLNYPKCISNCLWITTQWHFWKNHYLCLVIRSFSANPENSTLQTLQYNVFTLYWNFSYTTIWFSSFPFFLFLTCTSENVKLHIFILQLEDNKKRNFKQNFLRCF